MARKKRKTTKRRKSARRTSHGPVTVLAGKVAELRSRVGHLEERAVMKSSKAMAKKYLREAENEVY
jgi:hypothetical protein